MSIRNILIFLALLFFTACTEKMVDKKTEGEKLMQTSRDWSKLAATGNVDTILTYWAEDAVVMAPGEAALKGKQAIRGMIEASMKIPGFKISWEPKEVTISNSGDLAYMIEQNKVTVNDSLGHPITEYNKGVTVWRKEADGSWKNIVDTWNAEPEKK